MTVTCAERWNQVDGGTWAGRRLVWEVLAGYLGTTWVAISASTIHNLEIFGTAYCGLCWPVVERASCAPNSCNLHRAS